MRYSIVMTLICAAGCPSTRGDVGGSSEHGDTVDAVTAGTAAPGSSPSGDREVVANADTAQTHGGPPPIAAADDDTDGGLPGLGAVQGQAPPPISDHISTCDGSRTYSRPSSGWRCENTESYAQGPGYVRVEGATSVQQCFDACSARTDCTAVSDYFATRSGDACYLEHADCEMLSKAGFAEEDGGRTHRKICDDQGVCRFEEIADNFNCGDDWDSASKLDNAASIDDCFDACLSDPTCTGVRDYFYTLLVPGCYLNISTCDDPVMNYQDGALYLKCD